MWHPCGIKRRIAVGKGSDGKQKKCVETLLAVEIRAKRKKEREIAEKNDFVVEGKWTEPLWPFVHYLKPATKTMLKGYRRATAFERNGVWGCRTLW